MPSKTKTEDNGSEMVWEKDVSDTKEDRENRRKDSKGLDMKDATDCTQHWEDPAHLEQNQKEYKKFKEDDRRERSTSEDDQDQDQDQLSDEACGKKRGRGANASTASNKKQKSSAGKHDEPTGTAGDKTRVPKQGQKVQWEAQPGCVDGEVVEVVYEEKKVDGKKVKASKEDPRIALKSDSSGKISVHRPEAVHFD